ncbi:xanthine dehydrogenase [Arthrobacter sp. MYb227]|uniref:XdhC family protein n=1 Tax=Arthrobacter sp. MYb227 TaxID=1848601 RepID=UPI000CFB614D|nr:XdhC family protein [Arthrobacter sp. MYb227]PQZ95012.1 xanthine dehydrogenase [Arthrobacter sp. MYb227]
MLNLHTELNTALVAAGESFAVATIVGTEGSTPHPLGTSMLIHRDGTITGSLSGGCIEGAVHAAALDALEHNLPRREHYGYSSADAFAVGLTCGGNIDVHIAPFTEHSPMHQMLETYSSFNATDPVAMIRRIDLGSSGSTLIPNPSHLSLTELAQLLIPVVGKAGSSLAATLCYSLIVSGRTGTINLAQDTGSCATDSLELLVESRLSPPRMLIFGANTFAEELLKLAPMLGYTSTLCDARSSFTLQPRFNAAHEISTQWPHLYLGAEIAAGRIDSRTVICVLTHDPKFDIPLLTLALAQRVAYLGAMGSRTSHDSRMRDLRAGSTPESALRALHSPIGLDLQAITPGEVAISIAAEIIARRSSSATGQSLKSIAGPIHGRAKPTINAPERTQHLTDIEVPSWT